MKKLLKQISLWLLLLFGNLHAFSQCYTVDPPIPPPPSGSGSPQAVLESKNGHDLPVSGTLRVLVILAEINYDTGVDPTLPTNPASQWQPHQLPIWANNSNPDLNLFDYNPPAGTPHGLFTKYFYQASSGQYNVIGDYLQSPVNGGVFQFNFSQGVSFQNVFNNINAVMGGNFVTVHGLNNVTNFDNWTKTSAGLPKITPSIDSPHKYDHVMILWRNRQGYSGTGNASYNGFGSTFLGFDADTYSNFGASHGSGDMPFMIARHEFSHILYGGNNFHCGGGGGPTNYWIPLEGGWSNMGLYDCSLLTWNAWDKQRCDWKATGNVFNPSVRNAANTAEANGDMDATVASQPGIYTLRDFVTTGDAIRIKLPFTNPATEYNEWLWIENHNGVAMNASPFDGFQYQASAPTCIAPAPYGLYMYMQVDKDTRSGAAYGDVFGGHADYLRPITADGFYDRFMETSQVFNPCVSWGNTNAFVRESPNPFTGEGDQDLHSFDINNNNVLDATDIREGFVENQNGTYLYNLFLMGNPRNAFTLGGNKKIGVGTNPSSSTMMNLVSYIYPPPILGVKNVRKIYLNGVSVEILNQNANGTMQVQVRFDDVDVNNDTRWCGDEIVLNPVTTTTGYSLNIKTGSTVTLDLGTSPTRMDNPQIINGRKAFAPPTLFRCTANTWLNMQTGSNLIVDNNSTLRLEANSRLDIANGATLRVRRGGKLELLSNCTINVADGGKIIIEEEVGTNNDGILMFYPNARINLNGNTAQVEIAGNLSIQDNATFTVVSGGSATNTLGSVKFSSTDAISQNIAAGANCKFILQSNTKARKILYVNQESLYGPDNLLEFTLRRGTAIMAANSRIVAPVSNSCVINFDNAQLTTNNNLRNNHRGLRLNGQQQVTLLNSTFAKGSYGVYAYNTTLGNSLFMTNCSYIDCNNGLYSYDKSVNMTGSHFLSCGYGWYGEQMSLTSSFTQSSATYNTTAGIYYQGGSILNVNDPLIDYNSTGIVAKQAAVYVNCGSVSNNSKCGFHIVNNATLFMNTASSVAHSPVAAVNNDVTVLCAKANNLYFNLGYNNLKPIATGLQKTLSGTFKCQTYGSQAANKNNWNGTLNPLAASEYNITTSCSTPANVIFTDPVPIAALQCGQAIPPCNPPCNLNQMDPLKYCPSCDVINTDDYSNEKLNDASEDAKSMADNDAYTDNEKIALDKYNQILMESIPNPDNTENYILNYDYERMKQSFIDAYNKGQLLPTSDPSPDDTYMQKLLEVQDKIITSATVNGLYDVKLFVSLDKAQTYRIAGKISASILLLNEILSWAAPDEYEYVDYILCLTKIERDVLDGTMSQDDVEFEIINCTPALLRIANSSTSTPDLKIKTPPFSQEPNVFPNPANDFISIKGYNDALCTYSMTDVVGKQLLKETFKVYTDLPIDGFKSGIYFYTITSTDGKIKTGKLIKE